LEGVGEGAPGQYTHEAEQFRPQPMTASADALVRRANRAKMPLVGVESSGYARALRELNILVLYAHPESPYRVKAKAREASCPEAALARSAFDSYFSKIPWEQAWDSVSFARSISMHEAAHERKARHAVMGVLHVRDLLFLKVLKPSQARVVGAAAGSQENPRERFDAFVKHFGALERLKSRVRFASGYGLPEWVRKKLAVISKIKFGGRNAENA
jgi:hypothetical protein